jgi:hypothetical protein
MEQNDAADLLERIGVLRSRCDLDLLIFFARHPTSLLTSEQLATWIGYELKQIAASLETLLSARLLTRTQNPTRAARMYVFSVGTTGEGWIRPLVELAKTRAGRVALLNALATRSQAASPSASVSVSAASEGLRSPTLSIVRAGDATPKVKVARFHSRNSP